MPTSDATQTHIYISISDVPGDNMTDKLKHLNDCNCCARHQIDKPYIFSKWFDNKEPSDIFVCPECPCNCRHLARTICRKAPFSS